MAKNTHISCISGGPTQLTDVAVTEARVQGDQDFYLCATLTSTAPTDTDGAIWLKAHTILAADLALGDLFTGVGTTLYLWAWPRNAQTFVSVSHS